MQVATHRAIAGLLGIGEAAAVGASTWQAVGIAVTAYYCGGLPDLDTERSSISTELGPFSRLASEVVRTTAWVFRSWTANEHDVETDDEHRETSHVVEWSLLVAGLVWLALWWIDLVDTPWWFALAVLLGSVSHLLLGDLYTHSGIPLSFVWNVCTPGGNWRRHKVDLVGTDSPEEHVYVMWPVRTGLGAGMAWLVFGAWWLALVVGAVAGFLWHITVTLELHRRVTA
jgi:membrane-bound metal-dependent hydrolase YbcI (DUF457 family)